MTHIFESRVGNVGGSDIGIWDKTSVVLSLLMFAVSFCQQFE